MFGHESQPSLNYSYRAYEPTENGPLVFDQMRAAHRYRNKLVEIERARRAATDAKLLELFPQLAEVERQTTAAEKALADAEALIKSANATAKKNTATKEQRAEIKALKHARNLLFDQRRELRKESFGSPEWKAAQAGIDAADATARKEARANCGCYWANYLTIEQSLGNIRSGAPPVFSPWRGCGTIAVQIQGGMSIAEAFAGDDQRLRIDPLHPDAYSRKRNGKGRNNLRRTTLRMRVGTQVTQEMSKSKYSKVVKKMRIRKRPVWAAIPVVLHRPLPDDARIKWVFLHVEQTHPARRAEWKARFVLAREFGWGKEDSATGGEVGVDLGWRLVPEGLRVAYWVGDDGDEGQLVIPNRRGESDWNYLLEKSESLQRVRDLRFAETRDRLADRIVEIGDEWRASLPDWFLKRLDHLRQWRSPARLARFTSHWFANRFSGDESLWQVVAEWDKKERHLARWQAQNVRRFDRQRTDLYRNFAAMLSRKYHTVVMEKMDLSKFARLPGIEEETDGAVREHRREASVSTLRTFIQERAAESVFVEAKDTTRRCHACGHVSEFDRRDLLRTCPKCGDTHDQDANAARNLLASGKVPQEVA